jgi:hypothetical protein
MTAAAAATAVTANAVVILIGRPAAPASAGLGRMGVGSLLCSVVMGGSPAALGTGASFGSHRVPAGSECARRHRDIDAGGRLPVRLCRTWTDGSEPQGMQEEFESP